jgi:hypothetical protein
VFESVLGVGPGPVIRLSRQVDRPCDEGVGALRYMKICREGERGDFMRGGTRWLPGAPDMLPRRQIVFLREIGCSRPVRIFFLPRSNEL